MAQGQNDLFYLSNAATSCVPKNIRLGFFITCTWFTRFEYRRFR